MEESGLIDKTLEISEELERWWRDRETDAWWLVTSDRWFVYYIGIDLRVQVGSHCMDSWHGLSVYHVWVVYYYPEFVHLLWSWCVENINDYLIDQCLSLHHRPGDDYITWKRLSSHQLWRANSCYETTVDIDLCVDFHLPVGLFVWELISRLGSSVLIITIIYQWSFDWYITSVLQLCKNETSMTAGMTTLSKNWMSEAWMEMYAKPILLKMWLLHLKLCYILALNKWQSHQVEKEIS